MLSRNDDKKVLQTDRQTDIKTDRETFFKGISIVSNKDSTASDITQMKLHPPFLANQRCNMFSKVSKE